MENASATPASRHLRFYTYAAGDPDLAGRVVHDHIDVDGEGEPLDGRVILAVQGSPAECESKCRAVLADPASGEWLRWSAANILNELGAHNWTM